MARIPQRLFVRAIVMGYRRGQRQQNHNQNLVKVEGVTSKKDAQFYLGKRVAYVYKAKTEKNGTKTRIIWGRIIKAHGDNGTVRVNFRKNLPGESAGRPCRVMLYPSRI